MSVTLRTPCRGGPLHFNILVVRLCAALYFRQSPRYRAGSSGRKRPWFGFSDRCCFHPWLLFSTMGYWQVVSFLAKGTRQWDWVIVVCFSILYWCYLDFQRSQDLWWGSVDLNHLLLWTTRGYGACTLPYLIPFKPSAFPRMLFPHHVFEYIKVFKEVKRIRNHCMITNRMEGTKGFAPFAVRLGSQP
jgi:hypothetical protein